MDVLVSPRTRSFFVLRRDGVLDLGPEWPAAAVATPRADRFALLFHDDAGQVGRFEVHRTKAVPDLMRGAVDTLPLVDNPAISIARSVGKFGDASIYESFVTYARPGFGPKADSGEAKFLSGVIEKKEKRTGGGVVIRGLASADSIDRAFDIVRPTAFEESIVAYAKNPVLLWMHQMDRPIGSVEEIEIGEKGIPIVARVMDKTVGEWILEGRVRGFSVSFIPEADELVEGEKGAPQVRAITKAEILETSVVTVPCNRDTLFEVSKAIGGKAVQKAWTGWAPPSFVFEYRSLPVANEDELGEASYGTTLVEIEKALGKDAATLATPWDGQGAEDLRCASLVGDELVVVPTLVRRAMAHLLARTHDMTDAQREAVWANVARRWVDCFPDEEPPTVEDEYPAPGLFRRTIESAKAEEKTSVQSVICSKERFGSLASAKKWVSDHDFHAEKVDETDSSYRFRQFPPADCEEDSFRTISLDEGVSAAICRKKDGKCALPSKRKESETVKLGEMTIEEFRAAVRAAVKGEKTEEAEETAEETTEEETAEEETTAAPEAEASGNGEEEYVEIEAEDLRTLERFRDDPDSVGDEALEQALTAVPDDFEFDVETNEEE